MEDTKISKKKKIRTFLWLIILIVSVTNMVILVGKDAKTIYKDNDILQVSEPIFNSLDQSIQIEVKNTSDKALYGINIDLEPVALVEENTTVESRFSLAKLDSGQKAILKQINPDIKEMQSIKINSYYYTDSYGNSYDVTVQEYNKNGKLKVKSIQDEAYKSIKSDKIKLQVSKINEVDKGNKIETEFNIINNSDEKRNIINLVFQETKDNLVVENICIEDIEMLEPKKSTIVKVTSSKDSKLELVEYVYTKEVSQQKYMMRQYEVYPQLETYVRFEYKDPESDRYRSNFILVLGSLTIIATSFIDRIGKKLKDKGIKEENERKVKKGKILSIISWIIVAIYLIFILFIFDKIVF